MTKSKLKLAGYFFIFLSFYFFGLASYNFFALIAGDWATAKFITAVAAMFASVWGFRLALLLLLAKSKNLKFR